MTHDHEEVPLRQNLGVLLGDLRTTARAGKQAGFALTQGTIVMGTAYHVKVLQPRGPFGG